MSQKESGVVRHIVVKLVEKIYVCVVDPFLNYNSKIFKKNYGTFNVVWC
jgi:hypothetical protein